MSPLPLASLASLLIAFAAPQGPGSVVEPGHAALPRAPARVFATSMTLAGRGETVELLGGPPFAIAVLSPVLGGARLRAFGGELWVVNPVLGTLARIPTDGAPPEVIALGGQPQDVLVARGSAYASDAAGALVRVDLAKGDVLPFADLTVLARAGETARVDALERDGARLLVEVGLVVDATGASRGVLAVVDLASGALLDQDPVVPGVQGVALQGAPPQGKMQVLGRSLFVSTTGERLDERGGIEVVDLDRLESTGFVLTEQTVGADLGGFVMSSPSAGWFVFHTDIVASTHLKPFGAGGPAPGFEVLVLLGASVEELALDPVRGRVYLPSGDAFLPAPPAVHVVGTGRPAPLGALALAAPPRDVVVVP